MEAGSKIKGTVMGHAPGHMVILDMVEEDSGIASCVTDESKISAM